MFIICWPVFWPYSMIFDLKPVTNYLYLDLIVWPWPTIDLKKYSGLSGMFENPTKESNIIVVGQVVPEICHFLYFPWLMVAILDFGPYRCLKNLYPKILFLVHTQIKSNQSLSHFGHPIPKESSSQSTLTAPFSWCIYNKWYGINRNINSLVKWNSACSFLR